jgi:CDGSH-type Zn-finger protein
VKDEFGDAMPEVRVMEDGPLVLRGNFVLYDTDGRELKQMKMNSLCRCGASNNLPYCDGTHRKVGFTGK